MARQVLPIVGAVIGSFFPGAGTQIGYMIGALIGNAVDPQIIKGPSIGDGTQQTSKEGVPRPIVYGTGCIAGNLIDRGPIRKWIHKQRQSKGGPVTESERMSMTFAIRICEGPIGGILRIWEDEKLVYDIRPGSEIPQDSARYARRFRFYNGGETQLPDPALEALRPAGQTPSYRGSAYIVFDNLDVTDRRGSVPSFRFEVFEEGKTFGEIGVFGNGGVFQLANNSIELKGLITPAVSGDSRQRANLKVSRNQDFLSSSRSTMGGESFQVWKKVEQDYIELSVDLLPPGNRVFGTDWHPDRNLLGVVSYDTVLRQTHVSLYVVSNQGAIRVTTTVAHTDSSPLWGTEPWGDAVFTANGVFLVYNKLSSNNQSRAVTGKIRINGDAFMGPAEVLENNGHQVNFFSPTLKAHPTDDALVLQWYGNFFGAGLRIIDVGAAGTGIRVVSVAPMPTSSMLVGMASWSRTGRNVFVYSDSAVTKFPLIQNLQNDLVFSERETVIEDPSLKEVRRVENFVYFDEFYQSVYHRVPETGRNYIRTYRIEDSLPVPSQSDVEFENGQGLVIPTEYSAVVGQSRLGDIITDIAVRAKVSAAKLNLSQVNDQIVRGFTVAGAYNANNVLRTLQETFLFDPAEWDRKVHFIRRGGPAVALIGEGDLVDEPVEETRESAREYPQKLELFYQNPDVGYNAAKAVSERTSPDYTLSGTKGMESPVTMVVDEAWQLADIQMKVAWEEAKGNVVLKVSEELDFLTPTDCIGWYRRGIGQRLRIVKTDRADGVITLTCRFDRESAYRSDVIGLPVIPPTPPPSSITGQTIFQFLNTPALVDTLDPFLHYYYGATGTSDAWYGAAIERSVDGDDFEEVSRKSSPARMGELVEPFPYASEHYPDTTHTILVRMFRQDSILESVSQRQLLRENNGAAISRENGTAELIQFRDVEEVDDRVFRLSYVLRGRLNSQSDYHAPGAIFTFLDDVVSVTGDPTIMGQQLDHRATSFNESPEDSVIHEDTWQPILSQTEWPVALLEANLEGSNVAVKWSPRERFGTDINPIRSVNWQAYRVTWTDGVTSRTLDTVTPSATLDASGMNVPLSVSVAQVNRFTGPGPSQTVVVE